MQASKKNTAQNILKNQRFIQRYKTLDNQLQNTIFEYAVVLYQITIDGNNGTDAECDERVGQYHG